MTVGAISIRTKEERRISWCMAFSFLCGRLVHPPAKIDTQAERMGFPLHFGPVGRTEV